MESGPLERHIPRPIRIVVAVASAAGAFALYFAGDKTSAFWMGVLSAVFTWSSIAPRRVPKKGSEAFLEELRREAIGIAIVGVAFLLVAAAVLADLIPSQGCTGHRSRPRHRDQLPLRLFSPQDSRLPPRRANRARFHAAGRASAGRVAHPRPIEAVR
jgi:hypothetical protein